MTTKTTVVIAVPKDRRAEDEPVHFPVSASVAVSGWAPADYDKWVNKQKHRNPQAIDIYLECTTNDLQKYYG